MARARLGALGAPRGAAEALPGHAAWCAEGETLAGEARSLLAGDGDPDAARHLGAAPGGRAARAGVPEMLAPGHAEVAAPGERPEAAAGLDTDTRRVVADWRRARTAQTKLAEEVRALPGRAAAWERRRSQLAPDRHGEMDPADPACRAWREEGERLARSAAAMLSPGAAHAPWLDDPPETRPGVALAAGAVRSRRTAMRRSPG